TCNTLTAFVRFWATLYHPSVRPSGRAGGEGEGSAERPSHRPFPGRSLWGAAAMSVTVSTTRSRKPKNFPLYRTLPGFVRDPLKELERISRAANGEIVRLDLGIVRPLLVTRPEHLQIVLRERSDDYARDGIFWRPLDDLMGIGVLGGTSEAWATSRRVLQPVFTARNVRALNAVRRWRFEPVPAPVRVERLAVEHPRRGGLDHARGGDRTVDADGELDLDLARGARAQRVGRIARRRRADRTQLGGRGRGAARGLGLDRERDV